MASAKDEVVALYMAGVAIQTITDRTGIGRTSIRRILVAENVSRRPTGRPRMALPSQTVADLYNSGLTMAEVASRLKIPPGSAWARYVEVRGQLKVNLGRWHQVLLDAIEQQAAVLVIAAAADHLRQLPTNAQVHAARRAARELARAGVVSTGHVSAVWNGRRATYLAIFRANDD
jgi:hypothetical protein